MINVLFEDTHVLVVNKPAGLMVEPDRNGYPNLLNDVKKYLKQSQQLSDLYAQHLHRLDRPVSGIVLFAKKKEVLRPLSEQFAQREVTKKYQAITLNSPKDLQGELRHWHRKEKKRAMISTMKQDYMEEIWLDYVVSSQGDQFLWNISLHTGKFHQIRVQLSEVGCPILGDSYYGSNTPYLENSIALHASELTFRHPISNQMLTIHSTPPWELVLRNNLL